MQTLKVDIRAGEKLRFSGTGEVEVTMTAKSGQRARLEISADPEVKIDLPKNDSVMAAVGAGVNLRR